MQVLLACVLLLAAGFWIAVLVDEHTDWLDRWRRLPARYVPTVEDAIEWERTDAQGNRIYMACSHCGGWHARACPRVKRMVFAADGNLAEVEFWELWDDSEVIWPDQLPEIPAPTLEGEVVP